MSLKDMSQENILIKVFVTSFMDDPYILFQVIAAGPIVYVIGGEFMLGRSNWNKAGNFPHFLYLGIIIPKLKNLLLIKTLKS